MNDLLRELARLRATARRLLIQAQLSRVVVGVIIYIGVVGGIDFIFRLPAAGRLALLMVSVVVLGWVVVKKVVPAVRFWPSLVELALRVERYNPSVEGRLASAVDLALDETVRTNTLAQRSIVDASAKAGTISFRSIIAPATARWLLVLLVGVVGVSAWLSAAKPVEAETIVRRVVLPLGSAKWPARTALTSVLANDLVHARGEPLIVAVDLAKGDPNREAVHLQYRTVDGDTTGVWKTIAMTHQGGTRFERVIDTNTDTIEYFFLASDSETNRATVRVLPAPSILSSRVELTPPSYAASLGTYEAELGSGTDAFARLDRTVLEGTNATLSLTLNRALPLPSELATVFEWLDSPLSCVIDPDDNATWVVSFSLPHSGDLTVALEDSFGLKNLDPIRFRFDTVSDAAPSVTITHPTGDEAVSEHARIGVVVDARDDVSLSVVQLNMELHHNDEVSRVEVLKEARSCTTSTHSLSVTLDIQALGAVVGDELVLQALASDYFEEHDAVLSAPRRIKVVSESVVAEVLRTELSSIRRLAIRLEGEQADLQASTQTNGVKESTARQQARIGDQLQSAIEHLESIERKRAENRLSDSVLENVLEQGEDLLTAALRASTEATDASERAHTEQAPTTAPEEAAAAQETVRAELTDLADLLDRDEDAWVVQQRVQQMQERLEKLIAKTSEQAEDTLGRERSELTNAEREAIDELARDHAAEQTEAENLIDELTERARALAQADPAQSEGLRAAAEEAKEGELKESLERAAESAKNNQLQQTADAQAQAAEALEQMMEEIQASRKAKIEEIKRQIASLVESLEGLILFSEEELVLLARLDPTNQEETNIRVEQRKRLHANTLAVMAEARAVGTDGTRIARSIDRAAQSQSGSIGSLRLTPPDTEKARDQEERALASLKEALALAKEKAERIAEQQAKEALEELKKQYELILVLEQAIKRETEELKPEKQNALGRRGRVTSRRLGVEQLRVGEQLKDLQATFTETSDSLVFSLTHRNLDRWVEDAAARLAKGRVDEETIERQTMVIDSLAGLLLALSDSPKEDDPFEEPANGSGGSGEQQGGESPPQPLIPPIAELKALQALQQQILNATKRLDGRRGRLNETDLGTQLGALSSMQADLHAVGSALLTQLQPAKVEEGSDK